MAAPRIDAHQHFWDPAGEYDYPWIAGDFLPIRRRFEPADLRPSLERCGITGTVLVQTWNSLNETREFLKLAARTDFIAGVVGWVDLTDSDVAVLLAELKAGEHGRRLVGVRHLLHEEPDPGMGAARRCAPGTRRCRERRHRLRSGRQNGPSAGDAAHRCRLSALAFRARPYSETGNKRQGHRTVDVAHDAIRSAPRSCVV